MKISTALKALAGAAVVMLPLTATAESTFSSNGGVGALTSTARVDFAITIPKILYLRVGNGSAYPTTLTTGGTIDAISFSPTAAVLGNGTAVAGAGGDLTGGVSTAAIISNSGNVTLNATALGALSDGAAGDSISFAKITTTAAAFNFATLLPAPVLTDATSANVVLTAPATKVITADAKWTFAYVNNTTPPAGTYGGVNTNNSRVTYTATMP
jgi:hypothetical protein